MKSYEEILEDAHDAGRRARRVFWDERYAHRPIGGDGYQVYDERYNTVTHDGGEAAFDVAFDAVMAEWWQR